LVFPGAVDDPASALTPVPALAADRLDHWLDVACLFKTRSEAQRACKAGKVDVNGRAARPNRVLRPGDEVRITRGATGRQTVLVRGFAAHHVAKAEARRLYEDRTPPPTPEELEARRLERLVRQSAPPPTGAPHARDRRILRRLRGKH
jgi:ribosome-associated heat shock protein Hsp15